MKFQINSVNGHKLDGTTIEINTLEELIKFQLDQHDEIIIDARDCEIPEIEIYNGYRE